MKITRLFLIIMLAPMSIMAQGDWQPDVLGDGYQSRYIDQGRDYSGPVRSTIVRKQSPCGSSKGILYVHGYSDYFFQREMGDRFIDSCYNFYAVDLRKYGRSIMEGQEKFQVRNLREYFADIDSTLAVMRADGIDEVALIGHSTGGLITSLYMNESPDPIVKTLILNSPFLNWNLSQGMQKVAIPAVSSLLAPIAPNVKFANGAGGSAYSESLLRDHHGEWEYNTAWKPFESEKVSAGWLKAIEQAQWRLQSNAHIRVPILLMHSDNSVYGEQWDPSFQTGDGVLNVDDISRLGRRLGPMVAEVTIPEGMHDLVLSKPSARNATYDAIFQWLSSVFG